MFRKKSANRKNESKTVRMRNREMSKITLRKEMLQEIQKETSKYRLNEERQKCWKNAEINKRLREKNKFPKEEGKEEEKSTKIPLEWKEECWKNKEMLNENERYSIDKLYKESSAVAFKFTRCGFSFVHVQHMVLMTCSEEFKTLQLLLFQ